MSGFYLMYRDWQDNPLFGREAFSRRDAWVWLIEQACFTPKNINIAGKTVTLQRGQLSSSLRFMAKAWDWDEAKVRRFLSRARSEKMIDAATDAGQTIITICNYDKYQAPDFSSDAPSDAETTQQRRGGDAKYKEGKEGKEAKASSPRGAVVVFPRPDFADPQHWADLLTNRKQKRLPNTASAHAKMMADIARFADDEWPPGRLVQHAAEKGWGGIYDPRTGGNDNGFRKSGGNGIGKTDGFTSALRQAGGRQAC